MIVVQTSLPTLKTLQRASSTQALLCLKAVDWVNVEAQLRQKDHESRTKTSFQIRMIQNGALLKEA